MAQHCIPLCCEHDIRISRTADTAKLLNLSPVLDNCHKTGNSAVCSTIHKLIYHICLRETIMRQRSFFIIYHYCNRALVLQALVNPLIRDLTAVHSLSSLLLHLFGERLLHIRRLRCVVRIIGCISCNICKIKFFHRF